MLDHLPPRRDILQRLSYILAELTQAIAAATVANAGASMHNAFARQMIGQWPAGRLLAIFILGARRCRDLSFRLVLRNTCFQFGQL